MIGRNVYANYGSRMYANLFTLLVGFGESRKDTAIKLWHRDAQNDSIIRHKSDSHLECRDRARGHDVTQAEGLIGSLSATSQHPALPDRVLPPDGQGYAILPVLMEAFDTPAPEQTKPINAEMPVPVMEAFDTSTRTIAVQSQVGETQSRRVAKSAS
jgi:hypothetical protein